MRLLVFDPGETTGWAFLTDGKISGGSFPLWAQVKELINCYRPDVVLYESFYLRARAARHLIGSPFLTVQVIGVIRYLTDELGAVSVSQMPAQRTGILLKRMRGFDRHARDAVKHGLRYLIKQGLSKEYKSYKGRNRSIPTARGPIRRK